MATPKRLNPWNPIAPLFLGFSFGLAFAITMRLLDGRFANLVRLGERFEVKSFPGTGLEALRMRYGLDRVDLFAEPAIPPEPPTSSGSGTVETPPIPGQ